MHIAGTPAYWAYKKRLKHQLASGPASEPVCVIDVEATDVPVPDSEPVIITVETEKLTKSDLDILEDRTKWLNCKLINAGQLLMKKRFPAIQGLHDVTLSRTLSFPAHDRPFVQILNCAESHWICASNIGCKPNSIKVYDSNVTGDVPSSTKNALVTLMCTQAKVIYILYPDVQQQRDNSSCGLYALAYPYIHPMWREGSYECCLQWRESEIASSHVHKMPNSHILLMWSNTVSACEA